MNISSRRFVGTRRRTPATGFTPFLIVVTGALCAALAVLPGCGAGDRSETLNEDAMTSTEETASLFDLQGHRGARGLAPENTIASFQRALDHGVNTLEMDVVISADGRVVVSHDPYMLASICSHPDGRPVLPEEEADLVLYEMTYEDIRSYDCGIRGHSDFPRQEPVAATKPRLTDVIQFVEAWSEAGDGPAALYNIEIKSSPEGDGRLHPDPDEFVETVLDVVRSEGIEDRTTLQSFDPRILRALNELDASASLALLIARSQDRGLSVNLDELGFVPDTYSPDFRLVDDSLVTAVHDRGMRLVPWTVNEPDEMRRLIDLQVDGLITDNPDVAARVLGRE